MRLSVLRAAINPRNISLNPNNPSYKEQFFWAGIVLVGGWAAGTFIDREDQNRMVRFRDKSALFGKEKGPDDEPSWGDKIAGDSREYYWNFSKWEKKWWR